MTFDFDIVNCRVLDGDIPILLHMEDMLSSYLFCKSVLTHVMLNKLRCHAHF